MNQAHANRKQELWEPTWLVGLAFKRGGVAVLAVFGLQPPIKRDELLLSRRLEVLTWPCPTELAWHDLHKTAVGLHEVVVDQAGTMHANLQQTSKH